MKYIDLDKKFKMHTVFSITDIRLIQNSFNLRRLIEWQKKGYIKKVINGYYVFSDLKITETRLFEIGNHIYKPSYISLESALSYYGLIPESVLSVTSVSTRKSKNFETLFGKFIFKTLSPKFFFGYDIVVFNNHPILVAKPEKAILDFFYLKPDIKTKEDMIMLRLNKDVFFSKIRLKTLTEFSDIFAIKTLNEKIKLLWKVMRNA